ncbi:LysR family transcriptional regulator [Alginatibacterium sediminis]|uniref:LysR family transcriptional regulator n=1 Tax=Alginatibacterium sediminis TaxID=2164068 RepID=A0A420EH23_9ALTE|nr:LysR family transcriptional regulator [Alginatibacterium sediminis]RKF19964.1 LysR family transcriptional regulator [Alginatibacterium sediminis]
MATLPCATNYFELNSIQIIQACDCVSSMEKDYNLLHVLVVLFQTKQTVAAARKLQISQPSVSSMLKKLRVQFADELFVRNKNMLEPTPKCNELMDRIPQLLEMMDGLYETSGSWDVSQMRGEITLVFPTTLMAPVAPSLLAELNQRAPDLTVNCISWGSDTINHLEAGGNIWAVGYLPMETNKNVMQRPLPSDRFILVKRAGHPLTTNDLQSVLRHPICLSVIPGYIEASKAEMLIKKHKLDKSISVRTSDSALMLELIKSTNTIGVMSHRIDSTLPKQFETMPLPKELKNDTFQRGVSLFYHASNRHAPFTQWLFTQLDQQMRQKD